TAKAGDDSPAVDSQQVFGPSLTRVAAKIAPEVGGEAGRRRWLVQWILNPSVYHARTRMPVTHLAPDQAADVADWLLSQKVTGWDVPDPKAPTREELVALARVYLIKGPTITREEMERFLPAGPGDKPGIPLDKLDQLPPDADERRLEKVT